MARFSYENANILLTGATGGLGTIMAKMLADAGANLFLTARSADALQALSDSLQHTGVRIETAAADLAQSGEAARIANLALERTGRIDVLFNNAGVGYFALMEEATEQRIRELFELNTVAPMILIKTLLPAMKQTGIGRIVNIVSCAGRIPIPTVGAYGASKAALAAMTGTMGIELASSNIVMINIYPGTVDSSFEENALRESGRGGLCPTDHCGRPRDEIAAAIIEGAKGETGDLWLDKEGKRMALAALAWPGYVNRKLRPLRERVLSGDVKPPQPEKRRWRLLQIESSFACNLACRMCPWSGIREGAPSKRLMTEEVWNSVVPYLAQITSVDFTGGGEPLLQPKLPDWIAQAKEAGCEVGFLTNGMLLDEPTATRILDAGIDWIGFSIDGATKQVYEDIRQGADFERVIENVRRVVSMRIGRMPRLMINFVLMKNNFHQIEQIVQLAATLGIDQVNFKQCDVVRGDDGAGWGLFASAEAKQTRRLEKQLARAQRSARKLGLHTTAFSFTPDQQPVCDQDPRSSMFVRYDGTVSPCINLAIGGQSLFFGKPVEIPHVAYGQLPRDDFAKLFDGETCRFYRERFEQRARTHEAKIAEAAFETSWTKLQEKLAEAKEAMPEAPEGCRICHYLYDV